MILDFNLYLILYDNVWIFLQDIKVSLNEKYKFISKIGKLDSEEDSVNFDEIVAVSPPPNSE